MTIKKRRKSMNLFRSKLIHLQHCRGIGWKSIAAILSFDPSLTRLYQMTFSEFSRILSISENKVRIFLNDLHSIDIEVILKNYKSKKIYPITFFDKEYPDRLRHIFQPPWVLFAVGNINLLSEHKMISVVGTRKPSAYGYRAMEKLLVPLIFKQWTIVSGLAIGIDTYAHQLALNHNGKTIGVIAGGFEHIYPKQNEPLAQKIMEDQLMISEYPPDRKPEKWQFPMRNRIISGLSAGTIVIEAKARSGSLITADFALQQGREVFAVPGSILEPTSYGTHFLIQQGAKLVQHVNDIISEFS
jgi:DNA processing protein